MHHPIVLLRDVSFTYGDEIVLDHVNLTVPEGAFVGVVGPSGAGKTTLLRLMTGTLRPTAGEVRLGAGGAGSNGGARRGRHGSNGRGQGIRLGVVPQLEAIDWNFPVTVEEVVLMGRAADPGLLPWARPELRREARSILERLGIGHLARRHIRNLSGGQQQRAFIARALIRRPDLLVLDEPTIGVDVKTRHDILHLLHGLNHDGIAIVLTTHDLNAVAAHLPSLVCINRRIVAAGTPDEVLTTDVLRQLYGADMLVVRQDGMLLVGDVPSAFRDRHDRAAHAASTPVAHFGERPPPHGHGPGADHDHPDPTGHANRSPADHVDPDSARPTDADSAGPAPDRTAGR
jgi:zinc/manganese transport system ATP-binding protein